MERFRDGESTFEWRWAEQMVHLELKGGGVVGVVGVLGGGVGCVLFWGGVGRIKQLVYKPANFMTG